MATDSEPIPIGRHRRYRKHFPVAAEVPESARALAILGINPPTDDEPRRWTFSRGWRKGSDGKRVNVVRVGAKIGNGGPGHGPLWVNMESEAGEQPTMEAARAWARAYSERHGYAYEETTFP